MIRSYFATTAKHSIWRIPETVALKVRLFEETQLMAVWQSLVGNPFDETQLNWLLKAAVLEKYTVLVHPLLRPRKPIGTWRPGTSLPEATPLSEAARGRWTRNAHPATVYVASRRAANLFGSAAYELPDIDHRDHDLLLADVYVRYALHAPHLAMRWLSEQSLNKAGYRLKDPDAFILDDRGRPAWIVESCGKYSARQVAACLKFAEDYKIPIQLW